MFVFKNQRLLTRIVQGLFFAALVVVVLGTIAPGPSIPSPVVWNDKVLHFVGYFGLGLLGGTGWPERRHLLVLWMPLFGMALEFLQGAFIPWRSFEWMDGAANAVGAIAGIAASFLARRILFPALDVEDVEVSYAGKI